MNAPEALNTTSQPHTHPLLIRLIRSSELFGSYATSLVSLPAGTFFTRISHYIPAITKTYLTVENGSNTHIYLNSDLAYINHSCTPSLEFDISQMEVRVSRHRDLKEGDVLTYFYPSTEWEMAQEFSCQCSAVGAEEKQLQCKKWMRGAKYMIAEELDGYWLNKHIEDQIRKRDDFAATER